MSMKWAYERAMKQNVNCFLLNKQGIAPTIINLNKLNEYAKEEGYNVEETYNEATHLVGIGCKVVLGQGTELDIETLKKWCNNSRPIVH